MQGLIFLCVGQIDFERIAQRRQQVAGAQRVGASHQQIEVGAGAHDRVSISRQTQGLSLERDHGNTSHFEQMGRARQLMLERVAVYHRVDEVSLDFRFDGARHVLPAARAQMRTQQTHNAIGSGQPQYRLPVQRRMSVF